MAIILYSIAGFAAGTCIYNLINMMIKRRRYKMAGVTAWDAICSLVENPGTVNDLKAEYASIDNLIATVCTFDGLENEDVPEWE